jgi:CelD/BcsL family acetyltransferase involved in cellulose biosynthesis
VSFEVAAFFVTLARVFRSRGQADIFRSMRRRHFLRLTASQSAAAAQVSISGERRNFLAAVFSEMQNFPARR